MPTVLRVDGFAFGFFSAEHDPPHVHVEYGDSRCRIELRSLLVKNISMNARDLAKAVRLVAEHGDVLEHAWLEFQMRKRER